MSDKTVPHDTDEHRDHDEQADNSHVDRDPLVREAESDSNEIPNRDEDEFGKRHLRQPDVETDAREHAKQVTDED